MGNKISEAIDILEGVISEDIDTADVTGPYASVKNARKITAKFFTKTVVTATKVVTLKLMQAKDVGGTDAKQLGATVTVTSPAGGSKLSGIIEKDIGDLDINNGFTHVAVELGSDEGSAVIAGALLMLGDRRFS